MLVLSRKPAQALMIGDDVAVTVQWIKGDRVSLAIEAPPEVKVLRGELVRLEGDNDG